MTLGDTVGPAPAHGWLTDQAAARPPLLALRGVGHRYRIRGSEVHVLDDLSLDVAAGEFLCLLGPSGCGKTSLLHVLAGFLAPSEGEARFEGRPIDGPSPDRGVVFQQPALYPWLSVAENVAFGPRMRGIAPAEREDRGGALSDRPRPATAGRKRGEGPSPRMRNPTVRRSSHPAPQRPSVGIVHLGFPVALVDSARR